MSEPITLDELREMIEDAPGLEFGYIGNVWHDPYRDDRCYYIQMAPKKGDPVRRMEDSLWRCEATALSPEKLAEAKMIIGCYMAGFWMTAKVEGTYELLKESWEKEKARRRERRKQIQDLIVASIKGDQKSEAD